jgi:anti-sigma regulatory factor (Ser/Thr protein kinase)
MDERMTEPQLKLELLSQPRFLAAVRALISSLAQRVGFDEISCGQVSLAVDEALCNIINHGYDKRPDGRIWVNVWMVERDQPSLRIVIEDRAKQVDPQTIRSRDLEDIRPGGLGVYIIREVMDEASYEKREGGGMRLTLFKRVAPQARFGRAERGADAVGSSRYQAKDKR